MSIGELFDESIRIYRAHFGYFVRIAAVAIVPTTLVQLALQLVADALIVGGFYVLVLLSQAFTGLVIEERGAIDSPARSVVLVCGRWWRTLGVSFLLS